MTDFCERDPELVELALHHSVEPHRSELLTHLHHCARCRSTYNQLIEAVDLAAVAAPQLPPPVGFDLRVLAALTTNSSQQAAHWRGRTRRATRMLAVAAAVLAVATVALAVAPDLEERDRDVPVAAGTVALRTGNDEQVGTVAFGWLHDRRVLVVSVSKPVVGVGYRCRILRAQGPPQTVGHWEASSPRGGTWVVPAPPGKVTAVQLVTEPGHVWATARLR